MDAAATEKTDLALFERAQAWQEGDIDGLVVLGYSISEAYHDLDVDDLETKAKFRAACDELLVREKLPTMYRVQLLIFMAGTEAVGDYHRLRERLEDAKYWVTDLKFAVESSTVFDPRIDGLNETIDNMMNMLNEADPPPESNPDGLPTFEEKLAQVEEARRGARMMEEALAQDTEGPENADTAHMPTVVVVDEEQGANAGEGKESSSVAKEGGDGGGLLKPERALKTKGSLGSLRKKNIPPSMRRKVSNMTFQSQQVSVALRPKGGFAKSLGNKQEEDEIASKDDGMEL